MPPTTRRSAAAASATSSGANSAAVQPEPPQSPSLTSLPVQQVVKEVTKKPAYTSLKVGFKSDQVLRFMLTCMLIPLLAIWCYFLYQSELINPLLGMTKEQSYQVATKTAQLITQAAYERMSYTNLIMATLLIIIWYIARRAHSKRPVYLIDFATFTPPESWTCSTETFKRLQHSIPSFTKESLEFMDRLIERTGLGENTYFPPAFLHFNPPQTNLINARAEAETVIFGALDDLFAKTNTRPEEIDILVLNCSLFNPTPSMTAMIINKYKMREDIQSYNLSGMGCSAGVISVHLAKDLLQVYRKSIAVVVSTENITQNWYLGNQRSMLLSNTLFRCGAAAVLLSNRSSDRPRAKYALQHTVRTHMGADDKSYRAVFQDMDTEGKIGVALDTTLMKVAGEALKRNITALGPAILPFTEQIKYLTNVFNRKIRKQKLPAYTPNFKTCIDYFCIHAGGRAVIEAIKDALALSDDDVAASRATLHRYGNTSSSSIWYELAWVEKNRKVKRGQKVWQIAFGSGFKCNSAVWERL